MTGTLKWKSVSLVKGEMDIVKLSQLIFTMTKAPSWGWGRASMRAKSQWYLSLSKAPVS